MGIRPPTFAREEVEPCYREIHEAAARLRLVLHIEEIHKPQRVEAALSAIGAFQPHALLITPGPGFYEERQTVMQLRHLEAATDGCGLALAAVGCPAPDAGLVA